MSDKGHLCDSCARLVEYSAGDLVIQDAWYCPKMAHEKLPEFAYCPRHVPRDCDPARRRAARNTPADCDRCGAPLHKGSTRRVRADRRTTGSYTETRWVTDEFRRYYCPECAEEVKKAIRRCEMEGR